MPRGSDLTPTAAPASAERVDGFTDIMALAIEGSGTGLWDRDVTTGEIRYSPGWKAILGYQPHELSTRIEEAYTRVHPDDLAYVQATMQAHFEGRTETYEVEHRLRCKDGRWKWVLSRGRVVARDPAGRALRMVGTTTDITATRSLVDQLRKAEDDLRSQREQLLQAQKMEAVGQLTGGVAHDFNNMLQGIAGSLDMARRRMRQDRADDAIRFLELALETVQRASGLTRRLLAFARRQRLEPKSVDPDGLMAGMADLIRRTVGPAIELDLRLRDGAARVVCDPAELESALLNLCINARDAMPTGGRLTIDVAEILLSAEDVAGHDAAGPGPYVAISVTDSGCGMPADIVARAFEPFFTTKPIGHGTGLGLSQVYGFVRQSGGVVRIESAPGRGTIVRLFLPRHGDDMAMPAGMAARAPAAAGPDQTILLVDDEAAAREAVSERLRDLGYRVLEAGDGPAALRLLDGGAHADILVTDVGLPNGMNGRQVAEAVRERLPGLPLLFITGYAGSELPPGSDVINKPFELDVLARRIQALLSPAARGLAPDGNAPDVRGSGAHA